MSVERGEGKELEAGSLAPRVESRRRVLVEALVASAVVTGAVTAISMLAPSSAIATAVGFVFLLATWVLVWRTDDARVARFGLALGGVVMPGSLSVSLLGRAGWRAIAWALAFA